MKLIEAVKTRISKHTKLVLIALVVIAIATIAIIWATTDIFEKNTDSDLVGSAGQEKGPFERATDEIVLAYNYVQEGDLASAAESARKAAEYAPDEMDILIGAASVLRDEDPDAAKEIFALALELIKEQDSPDEEGKNISTYWAAGNLAEQAGETDQAIKYYRAALDAADPLNVDEQFIVDRSEAGLERLQ